MAGCLQVYNILCNFELLLENALFGCVSFNTKYEDEYFLINLIIFFYSRFYIHKWQDKTSLPGSRKGSGAVYYNNNLSKEWKSCQTVRLCSLSFCLYLSLFHAFLSTPGMLSLCFVLLSFASCLFNYVTVIFSWAHWHLITACLYLC